MIKMRTLANIILGATLVGCGGKPDSDATRGNAGHSFDGSVLHVNLSEDDKDRYVTAWDHDNDGLIDEAAFLNSKYMVNTGIIDPELLRGIPPSEWTHYLVPEIASEDAFINTRHTQELTPDLRSKLNGLYQALRGFQE